MPPVPRKYLHRRNNTPGYVPPLSALDDGLLGINTYDGILFTKVTQNSAESLAEFHASFRQPYTLDLSLSSISTTQGGNINTGVFSNVLGGFGNEVNGSGSSVLGGEGNLLNGDFSLSFGLNNFSNQDYTVILGSGLSASEPNYTYVNNLCSQGFVEADDLVSNNLYALNAGIVFTQTNSISSISSQTHSLTADTIVANNVNVIGQSLSATDIYATNLYAQNLHGNGSDITDLTRNQIDIPVNTKHSSFTLALSDYQAYLRIHSTSAGTVTLPANSAVPLKIGTHIKLLQIQTGAFTFAGDAGVTIITKDQNKKTLHGQGLKAELFKTDTNEWFLHGDLTN